MSDEIRKFNRGKDEVIDRDSWLTNASNGWEKFRNSLIGRTYLDSNKKKVKITDKDIEGLNKSYNSFYQRLNSGDDSLSYRYDRAERGFDDTQGELNSSSNPYDGLVAKYFGDELRKMNLYQEPKKKPLIDPVEYSDTAFGNIFLKRLMGSGTIRSFIDKDKWDPENKTRNNTERTNYSKEILTQLKNDLESRSNEFTDWNEDQKNATLSNIDRMFAIYDTDKSITDDEYFDLEKILGSSNIRDMYSTGKITDPVQYTQQTYQTETQPTETKPDKASTIYQQFGNTYSGNLASSITLDQPFDTPIGQNALSRVGKAFNNASPQDLTQLIQEILNGSAAEYTTFYKKVFPESSNNIFPLGPEYAKTKVFLLKNALFRLKNIEATHDYGLHSFGPDYPDIYYIGGTYGGKNRATGYVWDSQNKSIGEMSIYNIPYWQTYMNNWYDTNYPSYKQGGSIRKFDGGGSTAKEVAKYRFEDGTNDRFAYDVNTKTWNKRVNKAVKSDYNDKLYKSEGDVSEMQKSDMFQDWIKQLTTDEELAKNWARSYIANHSDPNIANYWSNKWYVDGEFNFENFQTEKGLNNKFVWEDNLGGIGHDIYAKSAYYNEDDGKYYSNLLDGYEEVGDWKFNDDDFVYIRNMKERQLSPEEKLLEERRKVYESAQQAKERGDDPNKIFNYGKSEVPETDTHQGRDPFGKRLIAALSNIANKTSDVLGEIPKEDLARLGFAFNTNNQQYKTLYPSIKPVLKDPLNLNKYLFGDYASKQQYSSLGDQALYSATYQNQVSDSEKMAARMFEGWRNKIDATMKGNLIDNDALRKSNDERFNLNKELTYYNQDRVYNPNRESLNQANRERAQLAAMRINKNWKSLDNFIQALDVKNQARKQEYSEYVKLQDELTNSNIYQDELDQISDLINDYMTKHPGESISKTPWWSSVSQRQTELARRLANDNVISAGKRRGFSYVDAYKDNPYKKQDWTNIIK